MVKPQGNYGCPTSELLSGCRSVRPDRLKKIPYYYTHTKNSVGLSTLRQPVSYSIRYCQILILYTLISSDYNQQICNVCKIVNKIL